MFKIKQPTPYRRVNFHIWILEKVCGRTLKRNSLKLTIQPYEKEEVIMAYTNTNCFNLVGYKIPINVAVAVAIVVILIAWAVYHFTKSISFYSTISIPVFVLMVAFFDKFLPDIILKAINFLLKKQWEKVCSDAKKLVASRKEHE